VTVPQETEVNIVRLHYGEHWPVETIAAQLGIHPDVVKRVLHCKRTREPGAPRSSLLTGSETRWMRPSGHGALVRDPAVGGLGEPSAGEGGPSATAVPALK
jgi:hypothetical protein